MKRIVLMPLFVCLMAIFIFNCEGMKGPIGPAGPQGEQGREGEKGEQGEDLEISIFTGTLRKGDLIEDFYWEIIFPFSLEDCSISVFVRGKGTNYEWVEPLWSFKDRKICISIIIDFLLAAAEIIVEPGYEYKIIISK